MICAHCGSETAEAPCSGCARSPLLGGRYRLLQGVATDESERVYRGEDSRSAGAVLLRRIDTRRVDAEDLVRALDAHLKPLLRIHHPGLPRRRRCEATQDAAWMVRQWIDGPTLEARIATEGAFSLGDALDVTARILEDLGVLHGQEPPIPHGALRPDNVRFDPQGRPVLLGRMGTLPLLEDPGHPHRELQEDPAGLAPEQRGGPPSPRADLYAAGALCIAMLTGRPADSLVHGGRIAWERAIALPPALGRWLDRVIDPAPGRRPASATSALRRLAEAREAAPAAALARRAPPPRTTAAEELPTMVVREALPPTVAARPVAAPSPAPWPSPEATPTRQGRRPAPADLAPTSIGRRPTAAEIAAAEPTTVGRRLTRDDIAAAEPTTVGRRLSDADITAAQQRRLDRAATEPTTVQPRPAVPERAGDPPTDRAAQPGSNPFDPPTGFARRASEIEYTGPRPPTLVRPPSEAPRTSAFENPVFVALGLALLGVALWQVVSRLTG